MSSPQLGAHLAAEKEEESIKMVTTTGREKTFRPVSALKETPKKSTNSRKRVQTPKSLSTPDPKRKTQEQTELVVLPSIGNDSLALGEEGHFAAGIGQLLAKKYIVEKMIGSGVYSTVYLAKTMTTKKMVALKIGRTGECFNEVSDKEIELMKQVGDASKAVSTPGSQNIIKLLDNFEVHGLYGRHSVMVIELLGPNLLDILNSNQQILTLPRIKSFTRNIVEGLDFLHQICGIVHLDLKPENFLSTVDPDNMDLSDPNCSVILKIADLGTSAGINEGVTDEVQTCHYRAPESFLKVRVTPAADLWSVGCTVYEMATRELLFECGIECERKWHLKKISELLGPIQSCFFETNVENKEILEDVFGNEEALIEDKTINDLLTSKELTKRCPRMTKTEVKQLCDFVKKFLSIDPKKRISVGEALKNPFLMEDS